MKIFLNDRKGEYFKAVTLTLDMKFFSLLGFRRPLSQDIVTTYDTYAFYWIQQLYRPHQTQPATLSRSSKALLIFHRQTKLFSEVFPADTQTDKRTGTGFPLLGIHPLAHFPCCLWRGHRCTFALCRVSPASDQQVKSPLCRFNIIESQAVLSSSSSPQIHIIECKG